MLVVFEHALINAEKTNLADDEAGLFLRFTAGRFSGAFHEIKLAAGNVPETDFRGLEATAKQNFPVAQDQKSDADARKVNAGQPCRRHDQFLAAEATISMKAGMSSPKPTGVGPSSRSR